MTSKRTMRWALLLALAACGPVSGGMGSDAATPQAFVCDGSCGDGACNANETCSSCATDCACLAANPCGFDPNLAFDFLGDVLQLQSADKTTCLWLSRTLSGGCKTAACVQAKFTVTAARIGHGGQVVKLGAGAAMAWQDTHHNLQDTASLSGPQAQFSLVLFGTDDRPARFDPAVPSTLSATASADGGASFCPVALVPYAP